MQDKAWTLGTMPRKDASLTGDRNEAYTVSTTMLSMISHLTSFDDVIILPGWDGAISCWALIVGEASSMNSVPHVETNPFFSTAMRHDATGYYVMLRFLDPRYD